MEEVAALPRSRITPSRIKRLRSEPRSVPIGGYPNGATPLIGNDDVRDETVEETPVWIPKIVNSVTMRPEISKGVPSSLYTSVEKVSEAKTATWMKPPRPNNGSLSPLSINRNYSGETLDLDPKRKLDRIQLSILSKELRDSGVEVIPGQTVVLDVLHHGEADPNLIISGDQSVRTAILNEAGVLISDIELAPANLPFEIEIPQDACKLCVTGLGGDAEVVNEIKPGPGAITTRCSTDNTVAIGFHPFSRLVNSLSSSVLCRGGVVMTGKNDKFAWDNASNWLSSSRDISMQMTSSIDVFVVVHPTNTKLQIEMKNAKIVETITDNFGSFDATICSIKGDDGILHCRINSHENVPIHSAFGALGNIEHWVEVLQTNDLSTIVEEGAISQTGTAFISFSKSIIYEAKSSSQQQRQAEVVEQNQSEYSLGQIVAGKTFKRDISKLAIDEDEGDVLSFSIVSGPKFVEISSEGIIIAKPKMSDKGKFAIEVAVKDKAGAIATAIFTGDIVESGNTAPRWKKEGEN
tara:strand:- start:134 stop:1699 length:1566 start_codon:yes stop_codon:yes gene_type:complete